MVYPIRICPHMTGAEFRRLRRRAGLSQRALAKRLGLHWNSVARMERDELPVREVVALAVRYVTSVVLPRPGRHLR
jgi:transcriptional regulator with XRE-family HTH domain